MTDHRNPGPDRENENEPSREYRDPELARLLAGDPTPDHRPDFWHDLAVAMRAQGNGVGGPVDAAGGPAVADGSDRVSRAHDRAAPDRAAAAHVADVADLDGRRRRPRFMGPALMAAAAAIVVAAGVFGAAQLDRDQLDVATDVGDGEPGGDALGDTTDVPGPAGGDDEAAPTGELADGAASGDAGSSSGAGVVERFDYFAPAESADRFDGWAHGFTPDGTALLFTADADGSELGCEAAERLTLVAKDLVTGDERPLLPDDMSLETGGIDLRFLGGVLADGGQRFAMTEYCDGVRLRTWTGLMAADGTVSDLVDVPRDEEATEANFWPVYVDDPFLPPELETDPQAGFRLISISPGGEVGLFTRDGALAVEELAGDGRWSFPLPIGLESYPPGAFDPTGSVVLAAVRGEPLSIWNFRTGERAEIGGPPAPDFAAVAEASVRLSFSTDGRKLLVSGIETSGDFATWVLNYSPVPADDNDERPAPPDEAPIDPTLCSGAEPFESAPAVDGLPAVVAERVLEIDAAAASCDWPTFERLTSGDFTADFGLTPALDVWRSPDGSDTGVMIWMRRVFRQPYGEEAIDGATRYVWPAVFTRESCEDYTSEDLASLTDLGQTQAEIDNQCEVLGGYVGYRGAITEGGEWQTFVVGD